MDRDEIRMHFWVRLYNDATLRHKPVDPFEAAGKGLQDFDRVFPKPECGPSKPPPPSSTCVIGG